ncbi:hypothetical protein HGRIS_010971 [Hohenbuehelia grisea]|uniref:S-adenosyl-L-methionine-dependent methyltransferase n=1 Tax=Hohenbuehelia grisea TaxID=104357 RepID=A0ABR3IYJ1_9AGAR
MKLSAALGLLFHIQFTLQIALLPTLKALWQRPSLIFTPSALINIFMAHVWSFMAVHIDQNAKLEKAELLPSNAFGVVLDIGAGHGHTVNYLDRSKVSQYIALEPNAMMHNEIRAFANGAGFSEADETLVILPCGAEDIDSILSLLGGKRRTVDTIVSVLALCSVPNAQAAINDIVHEVLKPGGQFLFYEHVASPRADVAWWQSFWTPLWRLVFGGCSLNRQTHLWVENIEGDGKTVWKEGRIWGQPNEPEENLFWHRSGRFVKAWSD